MPHRTVFQWGKNHAHPFTMFIGGLIIGTLVTGAVFLAYQAADDADIEIKDVTVPQQNTATESPARAVSPSPSAAVSF